MTKRPGRTGVVAGAVGLLVVAALGAHARRGEAAVARHFEIKASRYEFTPSRIEVRQGDTVELVFRSADTDHGFALKPYGVRLEIPKGGAAVTATFLADRAGRFPFACSEYCGAGHRRMRGELVVAEAAR